LISPPGFIVSVVLISPPGFINSSKSLISRDIDKQNHKEVREHEGKNDKPNNRR
jgi:hypothetical protein